MAKARDGAGAGDPRALLGSDPAFRRAPARPGSEVRDAGGGPDAAPVLPAGRRRRRAGLLPRAAARGDARWPRRGLVTARLSLRAWKLGLNTLGVLLDADLVDTQLVGNALAITGELWEEKLATNRE